MKKTLLLSILIMTVVAGAAYWNSGGAQTLPTKTAVTTPAAAPAASQPAPAPTAAPVATAPEKAAEAPAQDTQKWWQGLLVTAIEAVAAIVTPILSILLIVLLKKWNLKIEQDRVDWALSKAIGFAEQKAKVALKDGKPMEGPEIAKIAVEHGTKLLEQHKLASKFGDWLADGIEAKLGENVLADGGRNPRTALAGLEPYVSSESDNETKPE